MMPRESGGQNDAAVKSHPRRCSERHKEEDAAACPRLLRPPNILLLLSSRTKKSEGGGAAARASCMMMMMMLCLERTQHDTHKRVSKKTKRERERRDERVFLSLSQLYAKGKKKEDYCFFFCVDCFVSTRKMHRSIARVVQNDASLFFQSPIFFVSLSLSLHQFLKP